MRTVGVSQSTALIPGLWSPISVLLGIGTEVMGVLEIITSRPQGAHVATPLQDLCAELHTHTQYNAFYTTHPHTSSSLALIHKVLLITK